MNELKPYDKYILKAKEAAAYYSMGIKKMRRMCEEGEGIFAFYDGCCWLIVKSKFEEYLETEFLSGQKNKMIRAPEGGEESVG